MNIRNVLRKALLSEALLAEAAKVNYGCMMFNIQVGDKWVKIQDIIEEDDLYLGDGDFGREKKPHVTALYGLHLDVPDEDVDKVIDGVKPFSIELTKVSLFENELFDVVKFDVNSDELVRVNKELSKLPHTNSYSDYHPHVTIAYVKKGKGKKYVEKFKEEKPMEIEVKQARYSKIKGKDKLYTL